MKEYKCLMIANEVLDIPVLCLIDQQEPMTVQFISYPFHGSVSLKAGPAQFGYNLKVNPPVSQDCEFGILTVYSTCV